MNRIQLLLLAILFTGFTQLPAQIIYVNSTSSGLNNGSSWVNAYNSLQTALSNASQGHQIWVAEGTYKPTLIHNPDSSFNLKKGVEIYGGFNGTETGLNQRNWRTNITLLSGDIDNNDLASPARSVSDIIGYNSKHVLRIKKIDSTTVMDGFVITAGCANDTNPTEGGGAINMDTSYIRIINCTFQANKTHGSLGGGAIHNMAGSPKFINCRFVNNTAGGVGGAFKTKYGSPVFIGCLFLNNKNLYSGGGAIQESSAFIKLNNCTFVGNDSIALRNNASHATVTNCIFWGNIGGEIVDEGTSVATVSYSIVNGGYTGTGNLDADPLFINQSSGNFQLSSTSPAINAGKSDTSGLFLNAYDLDGNNRIEGALIDIGAFEYQSSSAIASQSVVETSFNIFPNPSNTNITCVVKMDKPSNLLIEVMDITGKVVQRTNYHQLPSGNNKLPLKLDNIGKGVYIISLKDSKEIYRNQKFVIQ